MSNKDLSLETTKEMMVGFMAAGYAGADVIEGFVRKIMPGTRQA